MNDFDDGNRSTRRKAWAYIVSLLGVSGIVEVGWIGQITLLDTIFNWGKIQAYLQSNNQGFVIGALVGIYLEIVKPNTISEIFRARLDTLDEFLRRVSNIDGVRFFLERQYGRVATANDLAQTVISNKPALDESYLTLAIMEIPNSSVFYRCDYKLAFTADLDCFILGFARTPAIAERLIHDGPNMTEVIVLDHEADFGRAVTTLMNEQPVVVNGVPLNFERLAQLAALPLRSSSLTEGVDYVVLSAQVPKPKSNSRLDFVVNYATSLPRDLGRQFWIADRPMFMREININLAGISDIDQLKFELLSFLGSVEDIGQFDMRKGKAHIHVGRWLVRGQGICVIWRRHQKNAVTKVPADLT